MPKALEEKLRKEYGDNPHAIYGTLNKIGMMHGNKETAKGKAYDKKHKMAKKMIEKRKEEKKTGYYGAKNFDEHYVPKIYRK